MLFVARRAQGIVEWEGHDLSEGPQAEWPLPKTVPVSYVTEFLAHELQPKMLLRGGGVERM